MPDINPSLPLVGQPDSSEEPKIVTALNQLIAAVNNVDTDQIADGTITAADLSAGLLGAIMPSGTVVATAATTADAGFLMCDGTAVSRTTYATLFGRIGTTHGSGDGSTTFNVPDLRGRAPIGAGTGSGLTARTLGAKLGVETHPLTEAELAAHDHAHTLSAASAGSHAHSGSALSAGSHSHAADGGGWLMGSVNRGIGGWFVNGSNSTGQIFLTGSSIGGAHTHSLSIAAAGAHTHSLTGAISNAGSGTAHENMQPSIALNYQIKT